MQLIKENLKERLSEFLMQKVVSLDAQTQADIQAGKKEIFFGDFYIRKRLVGAAGIVDFIKETDSYRANVTNIDKAKLYPGSHLAVGAIGVAYGYSNTVDLPEQVEYTNCVWRMDDVVADGGASVVSGATVPVRNIPVSIINSDLTIQAGGNLINKCRTKLFLSHNVLGSVGADANDENRLELLIPKLIPAEKLIKIQFEFGENAQALPAGNHFIEVSFFGAYVADRA